MNSEKLTLRVDDLDAKIESLNKSVSTSCSNIDEVIAYVDRNMHEMKDFLALIAKKLPQPTRFEVHGTLRKALILHFECCVTKQEFQITSHDWNKWLKIAFSLVKVKLSFIDI